MRVSRSHVLIAALSFVVPLGGLAVAAVMLPPDHLHAATTCPLCKRTVAAAR